MESFEHVCRVVLEQEDEAAHFVVSNNVKFFVRRRTKKAAYAEFQVHGYEIDLVAAREGKLVLAEVKSFFGSRGVSRQCFRGLATAGSRTQFDRFKVFNDLELRTAVTAEACESYGYEPHQVEWRMYVGNFANGHESEVREHLAQMDPPVRVVGLTEIVDCLTGLAQRRTYTDDPVIMTVKALAAAGRLVALDEHS